MCKGSTADSDSVCEGSNPSPAAKSIHLICYRIKCISFLSDHKPPKKLSVFNSPFAFLLIFLLIVIKPGLLTGFLLCHPLHISFHSGCAFFFHPFGYMTVNIKCKGCRCVSEVALYGLHIITVLQRKNCKRVPQIMYASIASTDTTN